MAVLFAVDSWDRRLRAEIEVSDKGEEEHFHMQNGQALTRAFDAVRKKVVADAFTPFVESGADESIVAEHLRRERVMRKGGHAATDSQVKKEIRLGASKRMNTLRILIYTM